MKWQIPIIILIIAALFLTGCSESIVNTNNNKLESTTSVEYLKDQSKIQKFSSEDDLRNFLEKNTQENSYYYSTGRSALGGSMAKSSVTIDMAMDFEESASIGNFDGDSQSTSSDDYSTTNIQVEGVDEADIVKTDGKYIYVVSKNTVFIISADNLEILSKITFKNMPQDIYINENKLVVFGNDYNNENIKSVYYRYSSFTYLKIFDTTDKENPKEVKDYDLEGYYQNSRMIGDYIYLITDSYKDINYLAEDDEVTPIILDDGEELNLGFPDVYYFRIPYNSYKLTTISAINVNDIEKDISRDVFVLSDSQNIYVSKDNIYLTYTKYISEYDLMMDITKEIILPKLSERDKEKIQKIENADSDILSDTEKKQKILEIIMYHTERLSEEEQEELEIEVKEELKRKYESIEKELQKTVIHKISIDKENIEYKATGEVTGRVLNQFSMDEKEGYFRIATTKDRTWSYFLYDEMDEKEREEAQKSYNNLYVLDEDLNIAGKLEGLASDESIYSVRFMQNRAYMVTFKQIDPLFVIDLSDNKNPKVMGELKIPGYSTYLHPYDDNFLMGLGYETKENKWGGTENLGIKLSLFDVSDIENPKEVDTYTTGYKGTSSQALYEHKAFLFSKEKNILVIPAEIREETEKDYYWGELSFTGALVFKVTEEGFELQGKIDHGTLEDKKDRENDYYWYDYETAVKRSLYIGENLYTVSSKYVKKNSLSELEELNSVELKDAEYVISGKEDSKDSIKPMPMPLVR
jgi:inhibitor of cysteine peptidase